MKDFARHPVKLYFDLGLRVTINTDNRLVTDTTISRELWLCHTKLGMPLADIKSLIVASFKSAFLPFHVKQQMLRGVSQELERFRPDGVVDPPRTPNPSKSQLRSSKQPVSVSDPSVDSTLNV